jgi:hypothetical protein
MQIINHTSKHTRARFLDTHIAKYLQAPPPSYIAPTGASYQTWPNVYMNLKNIDYCVDQFDQLT